MRYYIISLALCLSACSTAVPIKQEFPVAPQILFERCPQLMQIDDGKNTLREMLKVVIQNYSTYYQCAEKTHGWQEWYGEQKKVHNAVK
jgi:hypothetical protein